MPIVGIRRPALISRARFAGTHSSTIAKAPVGMHGLRLQPEMAHHRYTALDHSLNYIFMSVHALELDGVCAGDHQDRCRVESRSQPFSERKKRHVRDDEFAL